MKLIAAPVSPYSRKARIVLAEKRIDYELIVDSPLDPATRVPEFNPPGKIPVLVLDDETTLFDSRVIVEYLDSANPVGRLIPDDTRQRIQVRKQRLADREIGAEPGDPNDGAELPRLLHRMQSIPTPPDRARIRAISPTLRTEPDSVRRQRSHKR